MDEERISLASATTYILEECRTVLLGIEGLVGFQLVAVFSDEFKKLSHVEQLLHLCAIVLVTRIAPATLHRRAQPRAMSKRFIDLSSSPLLAGMFALAVGLRAGS